LQPLVLHDVVKRVRNDSYHEVKHQDYHDENFDDPKTPDDHNVKGRNVFINPDSLLIGDSVASAPIVVSWRLQITDGISNVSQNHGPATRNIWIVIEISIVLSADTLSIVITVIKLGSNLREDNREHHDEKSEHE
jgi:hypothetical protein